MFENYRKSGIIYVKAKLARSKSKYGNKIVSSTSELLIAPRATRAIKSSETRFKSFAFECKGNFLSGGTMEFEIDYQRNRRRRRRNQVLRRTLLWIVEIAAVILLAYVLMNVVLEKVRVPGDSMEQTLSDGDSILMNKFAYSFGEPERGDVIVFKQSGSEHDYYDIKRIVGLPGETIQIKNGKVYINDEPMEELIVCEEMRIPGLADTPVMLEENEYFVLGDNRNNSEDSRFANVGTVVREDIIGKAWLSLSPFGIVSQLNRNRPEE